MFNSEYKNNFEYILAYHCAPTLLGLKPASLVMIEASQINLVSKIVMFNKLASQINISAMVLYTCNSKSLILVYNKKLLENQLNKNMQMLSTFGYKKNDITDNLNRLSKSISSSSFPHEIGLFLGYPPEDVAGFIENGGRKYKLCGYWKVYGDTHKAVKLFLIYDNCREYLCSKISMGYSIYQALNLF